MLARSPIKLNCAWQKLLIPRRSFIYAIIAALLIVSLHLLNSGYVEKNKSPGRTDISIVRAQRGDRPPNFNEDKVNLPLPYKTPSISSTQVADEYSDVIANPAPSVSFTGRDPSSLHKKIISEKRDEPWASYSEKALMQNFEDIPYIKGKPNIKCASTICEVSGSVATDIPLENANFAMAKVQSLEIIPSGELYAFDNRLTSTAFGISKARPDDNSFVRYIFKRKSGYSNDK